MGKIFAGSTVLIALLAGGLMWYLQIYAFYEDVPPRGPEDVVLTPVDGSDPQPLAHSAFQAIDADSSPIRYRACFRTELRAEDLRAQYTPLDDMTPRNAPGWFDCFDAEAIGTALEEGRAQAFMGVKNIRYGVDRIVAITEDGRGYVWHDLNDCGAKAYDGTVVGEECPPLPSQ